MLPPSGVIALSEPDPEMMAMLSRAAENVGLVWNPPPRPDPSRLDMWFLGGGVALVLSAPLRCHSFRKCMRSLQDHGRHLLLPEINLVAPSPITTLDGGDAFGYTGLCPTVASTLRGEPCLPSQACTYSSGLTGSAYRAWGRWLLPYTPWRYCRPIRPKH